MKANDQVSQVLLNENTDELKRHGKHMLLYALIALAALALFLLGWLVFKSDVRLANVLINLGLALGPVSFLGIIYEWFLFDEIRAGAKMALAAEIASCISPVLDKMEEHGQELMDNTYILSQIHKLGIIKAYEDRRSAFSVLKEQMEHEHHEIFLIGTSLRGLLDEEIGDVAFQEILKDKFEKIEKGTLKLRIKILLTHPAFAYLRQDLEKLQSRKEEFSIGQEIYDAVLQLKRLGAKPYHIQFVKGTPTCFAVKTSKNMLINPYPYQDQALGSFCLVISNEPNRDYIYRLFERTHFIWDSPNTEPLDSFEYSGMVSIFHKSLQELMPSPPHVKVQEDQLKD